MKNYTPAVTEIFHLIETDLGRPIAHIASRIAYDDLEERCPRVTRTLGTSTARPRMPATGTRYLVRVLPYRSVDNYIGGTVVTFTDITPLTRAQQALRESEERFRAMAEQAEVGIAMVDRDTRVIYVNERYCQMMGTRTRGDHRPHGRGTDASRGLAPQQAFAGAGALGRRAVRDREAAPAP